MPVTMVEKYLSRPSSGGDNPSCELIYILMGSDDEVALKAALEAGTPLIHEGLVRKSWAVEPMATEIWTGTVRYGTAEGSKDPESTDIGTITLSVDTSGGTQHLTQSLETITRKGYVVDGVEQTAPNFYGAINVTHDAVDGVDIVAPAFKFTVTKIFGTKDPIPDTDPPEALPDEVKLPEFVDLFKLTGKTNQAAFTVTDTISGVSLTFEIGEVLFMGARVAEPRADGGVVITYEFSASPNVTDLEIGTIAVGDKKGWQYLWVRYADAEDSAAKMVVKRPIAAYVERVYEPGDFSKLKTNPIP